MFFIPAARNSIKSSSVEQLEISPATNQALVTFKGGNQYLYSNIAEDALFDVIFYNVKSFGKWVNEHCKNADDVSCFPIAAWLLSLIKQHIYNTRIMPETLTEFQQHIANILGIDSVTRTDLFRHELEGYGVESVEDFEDSYFGCYPDVQTFVEDFVNDCYSDCINNLPTWLQTAIDYELIWYQSLRHDFFEVSFDGEVYIFNRHW